MLRLRALYGHEEVYFALPETEAELGSAAGNDLRLCALGVSRRHACVRRTEGGVELVDLGSKNGLLVEGERVKRAVLTPGLRVQIGTAWLELEELSSTQASLELRWQEAPPSLSTLPGGTPAVHVRLDGRSRTPEVIMLELARHLAAVGAGLPGSRVDLLVRIAAVLGADAFATLERTPRGAFRLLELSGGLTAREIHGLAALAKERRNPAAVGPYLGRRARHLLAGRDPWYVAARLPDEASAREGWRRDFVRFLAAQLFPPVRTLDVLTAAEAERVLALVRGNKRRAATMLGVSPGTLYALLRRARATR